MKFPSIADIATLSIISLDIKETLSRALEIMLEQEHRNLVVIDNGRFRLLNVMDIIQKQEEQINLDILLEDMNLIEIPTIEKHNNVLDALKYVNHVTQHICAVNRDGSLYGIIAHSDIIANIDPETLMDNYRLEDFLKLGRNMKTISVNDKTLDVLKTMAEDIFDNVIAVKDLKPIGILTTKDVMRLIRRRDDLELPISQYLSSPVETIKKTSSIKNALEFLKNKHYKRVVVVDENGALEGVISQKELISLTYSRWATLMKEYQNELNEINVLLQNKNKEYEVMATTDSLTGLYNRYKFTELYNSTYKTMIQRDATMSLMLIDIDLFKNVNDTFGHNVGDKVIVQIAHTILRTLRNVDIVCRWGGEEFLVLVPTANLVQATILANKIRKNTQELVIDTVGSVTISVGVSEVKEGDSMNDTVQRADEALYLAKESGRNCVKTELDI